ncbi:hypothetical protein GCM10027321_12440 [Massilia terrae]|uniref:Type II toxin-antitoxin system HigB family toxin n=1 Tax=Massilia terrae TaxID=1811224 RepID=A0ABT2D364_9BURK|nr:type II toxin-antitoxin system HigB family toxin [Massilia terrae]MCS0660475.1 type II toxin-antitoxin system HigB family toxin [Massilia terrae]
MNLIYKSEVAKFATTHPEAAARLDGWMIENATVHSFSELKQVYRRCDYVPKRFTIFDVGGTSYRVVTTIDYRNQRVYIHKVLTHAEYDQWTRKNRRK